jgi:hypothetical protein
MRAEFEPYKKEFSFWFDGETVFAKYSTDKVIDAFSTSADGLEMIHPRTIQDFEGLQTGETSPDEATDKLKALQGLRLVESNQLIEGTHRFRTDETGRSSMAARLQEAKAQGTMKGRLERGDVGEDMAVVFFQELQWKEVVRHPFSRLKTGRGSAKRGTDVLFRDESTGELYLVEVKWWKNPKAALREGSKDLKRRRAREQRDQTWGPIRGAYIAAIDYDLRKVEGELHVKRVW